MTVVDAEMRKVCERGHTPWNWRPWYRGTNTVLGHCACGAPYRLETRGAPPLSKRGVALAGDAVAALVPDCADPEALSVAAIRAYLNELDRPIPAGATERATPVSQGVDPPALTRSLPAAPHPGRPSSESSHESDGAK